MAYTDPAKKSEAGGKDSSDFIAEARKRLQVAIDAFDATRKDELDDIRFAAATPDNGWQWPEKVRQARLNDPNGARPVLTINKLPQHIKLVTNEQRQNRPSIKVIPVDDNADVDTAEVLNGIIRHIEANSDADIAYDTACEMQVTAGEGYFRVLTDYVDEMAFEQDILIAPIRNPFSVYMEPEGLRRDPTGRYCKWAFVTDRMSKKEFEKQFPNAKNTNWELLGTGDQSKGWVDGDEVTIAEYFYVEDKPAKLVQWSDGSVTKDDEMPKIAGLMPVTTKDVTLAKVCWVKMSPLEELERGEWAGKYIPIVRVIGNEYEVEGKLVISGLVRNAKDACRMYNYWVSQEAEILAMAPKAPFIGPAGAFEGFEAKWKSANTVNYPYLEYNPVVEQGVAIPPPQRSAPPIPPAGFIQAKMGASDDIQSTVGQYNPSLGAEAKEKSGKAIVARQRQADVGTFHYMDNLARAIRQCGRIVVDLIPKIYDTKRVARILGEDGELDHVTIDPEQSQASMEVEDENGEIQKIYNPGVGQYDVRVTVGPSYTTQRQEAAQMMIDLAQGVSDPQISLVMRYLAIKNMDWSGAEDLAGILKKMLPPQLVEDKEEQEPVINTPMGPIPASQVGQVMAQMQSQLEQAAQQIKQAGDLREEDMRVRESKAEVQRMLDSINAKDTEIALREQLAMKTLQAESAKNDAERENIIADMRLMVGEAVAKLEGMKKAIELAKEGEDSALVAEQNMAAEQNNAAVAAMQQELLGRLSQAIAMLAAPRRTSLEIGPDGVPVGAVSQLVQ